VCWAARGRGRGSGTGTGVGTAAAAPLPGDATSRGRGGGTDDPMVAGDVGVVARGDCPGRGRGGGTVGADKNVDPKATAGRGRASGVGGENSSCRLPRLPVLPALPALPVANRRCPLLARPAVLRCSSIGFCCTNRPRGSV